MSDHYPAVASWAAIPSCPGYEASSDGRIRSLKRGTPRPISLHEKNGYPAFFAWQNGRSRFVKVHVAAAEAFYGPRPEDSQVRHLDGNPLNNTLENLRYGTPSENMYDVVRHGRHNMARKTHCPAGHPYDESNTWRSGRGGRFCRACAAIRRRRRLAGAR